MPGETASRRPGWAKWRSKDEAKWQLAEWAVPHLHTANQEEQLGNKTNPATQGSSVGK